MKNQQLLTDLYKAIAPAVTKFHLDLQLSLKSRDDSEYSVSSRTIRYIAEDTMDIALELVNEMEKEVSSIKSETSSVKITAAKKTARPSKTAVPLKKVKK